MPTKPRRCSKRQKRKPCETPSAAQQQDDVDTRKEHAPAAAAVCAVCRRQTHGCVITCPCGRSTCQLCLQAAVTADVNCLKCPACPDTSLASTTRWFIGTVKNLWLSATSGTEADSCAQNRCQVHSRQAAELWCLLCDVQVCLVCKLAEHEGHPTHSVKLLAAEAGKRVTDAGSTRLRRYEDRLRTAVEETGQRREALAQMRQDVEDGIHRRHARLSRISNKLSSFHKQRALRGFITEHRDSALLELEAMAVEAESCLVADEVRLQDELNVVAHLQRRVKQSVGGVDPVSVITLDREIEAAWSCDNIIIRLSKALPSYTYTLKHDFSNVDTDSEPLKKAFLSADVSKLKKCVDRFIGHATKTEIPFPKMPIDVKVTPMFRCCEDPEAFVLSVCPTGAEKLAVSYSTSNDHTEGVTKSFFRDGRPSKSFDFGLCTLIRHENGVFSALPFSSAQVLCWTVRSMWSKSGTKWTLSYGLGTTWILMSLFTLPSPFDKIFRRCLPTSLIPEVDAVAPLAFDVTRDGSLLAIVDVRNKDCSPLDNNLGRTDRVVRLISLCGEHQFTDDYEPPPAPAFLPSDVCFFSLQGRMVLLVSDMATSSIHVVAVSPLQQGKLTVQVCRFQRYLVADCDIMERPTALNTDEKGLLWVSCKGGQLLTVEPAT